MKIWCYLYDRNTITNLLADAERNSSTIVNNDENTQITQYSASQVSKLKNQKRNPAEATVEGWNYKINTQMVIVFY